MSRDGDIPETCEAADSCDEPPTHRAEHEQGCVTVTRHYCRPHGRACDATPLDETVTEAGR